MFKSVYQYRFNINRAENGLLANRYLISYLPFKQNPIRRINIFKPISEFLVAIINGLLWGFIVGGIVGFLNGIDTLNLSQYSQYLLGKEFIATLELSLVQQSIALWGFTIGFFSVGITCVLKAITHTQQVLSDKKLSSTEQNQGNTSSQPTIAV